MGFCCRSKELLRTSKVIFTTFFAEMLSGFFVTRSGGSGGMCGPSGDAGAAARVAAGTSAGNVLKKILGELLQNAGKYVQRKCKAVGLLWQNSFSTKKALSHQNTRRIR
jgi:hypothetical protein